MRPRFNTLELDLTCTRNKFPITDRRRKIEQLQLQQPAQQQQTSAPATPSEWGAQYQRRNSVGSQSSQSTVRKLTSATTPGSESATSNGSVLLAAANATTTTASLTELMKLAPKSAT